MNTPQADQSTQSDPTFSSLAVTASRTGNVLHRKSFQNKSIKIEVWFDCVSKKSTSDQLRVDFLEEHETLSDRWTDRQTICEVISRHSQYDAVMTWSNSETQQEDVLTHVKEVWCLLIESEAPLFFSYFYLSLTAAVCLSVCLSVKTTEGNSWALFSCVSTRPLSSGLFMFTSSLDYLAPCWTTVVCVSGWSPLTCLETTQCRTVIGSPFTKKTKRCSVAAGTWPIKIWES